MSKNFNFSTFWTSCFYSLERLFFCSRISWKTFSWPILPKKTQFGKMAFFGPKHWVNPFGKMFILSTFWTSSFYRLESLFFVLEYRERHFPCICCLKKQVGIMVIFGPKRWVNAFGKSQFFHFLNFLFL